jgi:hypothetical protein
VRRDTVRRLARLVDGAADTRVVLIADDAHHDTIRDASRLLRRAGLDIPVAALAPRNATLTGADW